MAQSGRAIAQPRQKHNISYVIRDEVEPDHRGGVNCLRYDHHKKRLYTGGRDAIIRGWDLSSVQKKNAVQMEHHTDWVNDLVVIDNGNLVMSGSSDTALKIFSTQCGTCRVSLKPHLDYVRALAYAEEANIAISVGLDSPVYFWDIGTLTNISKIAKFDYSKLVGHKKSVYSVACNPDRSVVVSGGTENIIRVWDGRSMSKVCKLRGHQDNIRALLVSNDGTQCLSGSSDGTVRLWSLGQQRCLATVRCHESGVWTMLTRPDNFLHVYSGGRDGNVFLTDLRTLDASEYILHEKAPITKIEMDADQRLWVATSESSVNLWDPSSNADMTEPVTSTTTSSSTSNGLASGTTSNGLASPGELPLLKRPGFSITGAPALLKTQQLVDRRRVLTQDTDGSVDMWDVFQGKKIKSLGKVNYDEAVDAEQGTEKVYVPNWCTINCSTGYLTVTLDECDCYSAWVYAQECGIPDNDIDMKLNLGAILLHALFENWVEAGTQRELPQDEDSDLVGIERGNGYYQLAPHLPLYISETGDAGRTLFRSTVMDLKKFSPKSALLEIMPMWAGDVVLKRALPRWVKITFFLEPFKNTVLRPLKKDRLSAHDVLEVQKVLDHLHMCLFTADEALMQRHVKAASWKEAAPSDVLELVLNGQVLDPKMDLRTVRHFFWKSGAEMKMKYRLVEERPAPGADSATSSS
eukprot:scpid8308/ scgid24651/ WD repeat-containing protein 48; USP1-associated factor 1